MQERKKRLAEVVIEEVGLRGLTRGGQPVKGCVSGGSGAEYTDIRLVTAVNCG